MSNIRGFSPCVEGGENDLVTKQIKKQITITNSWGRGSTRTQNFYNILSKILIFKQSRKCDWYWEKKVVNRN